MIPYIEEQSFGDDARLKAFGYDQLISELGHSAVVHNAVVHNAVVHNGDDDQPEGAMAGGAVEHTRSRVPGSGVRVRRLAKR